jgi:hypothetical protein
MSRMDSFPVRRFPISAEMQKRQVGDLSLRMNMIERELNKNNIKIIIVVIIIIIIILLLLLLLL